MYNLYKFFEQFGALMEERVEVLHTTDGRKNTLYLMQRDQRAQKNHSFNLAYNISSKKQTHFYVGIYKQSHKENRIQDYFMLDSLPSLNKEFDQYNIPILMIYDLYGAIKALNVDTIVVEFSPLREMLVFHKELLEFCKMYSIGLYRCDSHNIIPCKLLKTYLKTPFAVKTELKKLFPKFNVEYPAVQKYTYNKDPIPESECFNPIYRHPRPLIYLECKFRSGCEAAQKTLDEFLQTKLRGYKKYRNDVDKDHISNLSPYLHLGQISAHHVVTAALKYEKELPEDVNCFVSEVFHWREIAEHFCLHEKNYDNIEGAPLWARNTLESHRSDKREHLYTIEQLESAKTHDKEWNAAQNQLITEHKIHGYVRMYWAKCLLRWTIDEKTALSYAIHLNDMLSIDGNDPNGYLGIMWSICGVMDREFEDSKYSGKVRTMKGIRAKKYTEKWNTKSSILKFL